MIRCGHVVFFTSEASGVSHTRHRPTALRATGTTTLRVVIRTHRPSGATAGHRRALGVGWTGTLIGSREPPCQPTPRGVRTRRDHDLIGGVARGGPARRAPRTRDQRADTGLPAVRCTDGQPRRAHHVLQEDAWDAPASGSSPSLACAPLPTPGCGEVSVDRRVTRPVGLSSFPVDPQAPESRSPSPYLLRDDDYSHFDPRVRFEGTAACPSGRRFRPRGGGERRRRDRGRHDDG